MMSEDGAALSFSREIKNELYRIIPKPRHCRIAELAAITFFLGKMRKKNEKITIYLETENAEISRKYFTLLHKTINIGGCDSEILPEGWEDEICQLLKIKNGSISGGVDERIIQQPCCKKSFLRGAFLAGGTVSDPRKGYHFEITVPSIEIGKQLIRIMDSFGFSAKTAERKGRTIVYLKESEQISDALGQMGASTAYLQMENVRILKGMRSDVNRIVNCEAANISRTVSAAYRQQEDIRFLMERDALSRLPQSLQEAAQLRLKYPDIALSSLGEMCKPPVGKSGMNHRLRRLSAEAEKLRIQEDNK